MLQAPKQQSAQHVPDNSIDGRRMAYSRIELTNSIPDSRFHPPGCSRDERSEFVLTGSMIPSFAFSFDVVGLAHLIGCDPTARKTHRLRSSNCMTGGASLSTLTPIRVKPAGLLTSYTFDRAAHFLLARSRTRSPRNKPSRPGLL